MKGLLKKSSGRRSIQRNAFSTMAQTKVIRAPVFKGTVTPMRGVLDHIAHPDYAFSGRPKTSPKTVQLFNDPIDLMKIRRSARLARKMLDYANSLVEAGITTEEIDILTHQEIVSHGAYPSPINYCGFPKAICTSVNEVVCHGIPDSRKLVEGDMISIDVSLFLDGFHGDNCCTVIVGKAQDDGALKLLNAAQECLNSAIAICGPGTCFAEIGAAIERVSFERDVKIVQEFCGHGTGPTLHMQPMVEHCRNKSKLIMAKGMVFTIEPIIVEGARRISIWEDGWTAATLDGGRGAQFEHEILITEDGCEVLTVPE